MRSQCKSGNALMQDKEEWSFWISSNIIRYIMQMETNKIIYQVFELNFQ